jgi:hypothetical protein
MRSTFKVGDHVIALATADRGAVSGLIVESVTLHGGQHGVAPYFRLNCLAYRPNAKVIQVEASERFFAHEFTAEHYDYERQAWIGADGRYLSCAHPAAMNCNCYGRLHYGEVANA